MVARLVFLLVLVPVLALTSPAQADYVTGLNPRGDNFLALRAGPGTGYRMILRMGPETIVTVLERRGDWVRVELEDGTRGWAFGAYIAPGLPRGYDEGPGEELVELVEEDQAPPEGPPADDAAGIRKGVDLAAVGAAVAGRWSTYANARFATGIDYPAELYRPLPPPDNGDGRAFEAAAGAGGFTVFGAHNVFGMTLGELMADDEAAGGYDAVTYRRSGEDWYALSGYRTGDVFYRKVLLSDGGSVIHTFEITYPRAAKSLLDPVTARMANSLHGGAGAGTAGTRTKEERAPLAGGFEEQQGEEAPPETEATSAPEKPSVSADAWKAPLAETLFEGAETPLFLPHAAHGGVFAQHARYEDGALIVDVPPGNGWGKAGLLSNDPLVWLDDFRDDAEVRVTFTLDPARTTGFGLALTQTGWGGVGGNDPGPPSARFYWIRATDGASATGELHVDPHREGDFFKESLSPEAPSGVTFVLRPGEVAIEVDGRVLASRPWTSLADGVGLRIYAFSHVAEVQGPAGMALERVGVSRTYPTVPALEGPARDVEPLPVEALFDGTPSDAFEPAALAGGDFERFARFKGGALVVDVPADSNWGKTGLLTAAPLVVLDERNRQTPTRVTLTVDPAATDTFVLALGGNKAAEMWFDHSAWFVLSRREDLGAYLLQIHASPYNDRIRRIPIDWFDAWWDGRVDYDVGQDFSCLRIPAGPKLCAQTPTGAGQSLYATILAHAPAEDAPTRLALKRIDRGLATPPGMTADRRWFFVDDEEFDPAQYLEELGSLLQ